MEALTREDILHWIEALKSGAYQQGRGTLRSDLGFCCLGVLCDQMIVRHRVHSTWESTGYRDASKFEGQMGSLPDEWTEDLSRYNISTCELIEMNDETKVSFRDIANYLKKKLFYTKEPPHAL